MGIVTKHTTCVHIKTCLHLLTTFLIQISSYEILVGNSNAIKWVPTGGVLRVDQLGARPVEGGHENDGTPIYVASVDFHGSRHCGKATTKLDGKLQITS